MEDISVGSVAVDIVPDTRRFATDLKSKLKGITAQIGVTADTAKLRAQLDEATQARTATVNVDADSAAAEAKIDEVARDRTANIRVNSSGLGSASRGLGGMATAALTLGPALIPIAAGVTAIGAVLAAPLAAAGGGLTVGAIIAGAAITQTEKQKKQIEELAKKVQSAKLAVDKASTKSGKKSAMADLAVATTAYHTALSNLSPQQRKFLNAQDRMKVAFGKLLGGASGKAIFTPIVTVMDDLAKVMPKLTPLLVGVSKGIGTLFGGIGKAVDSPGFARFMQWFSLEAQASIVAFGKIFGNIGKGLAGIFEAFAPLSGRFLSGLGDLAQKFADFGQGASGNKGFQSFIAYVKQEGPVVADTIKNIAKFAGRLVGFLAPLGGMVLSGLDGLFRFLVQAKPSTIAAIGVAVGGVALALGKGKLGLAFALAATLAHSDKFISFLKTAGGYAKDFGKWFDKLPDGIKAASVALVGVGALAVKFRGLFGGKSALGGKGGIFGMFTKMRPVPVIIVKDLSGRGPGGGGPDGGTTKSTEKTIEKERGPIARTLSKAIKFGKFAGLPGLFSVTTGTAFNKFGGREPMSGSPLSGLHNVKMPSITGWAANKIAGMVGDDDKVRGATKRLSDQVVTLNRGIAALPRGRRVEIDAPGLTGVMSNVKKYGGMLDHLDGRVVKTFIETTTRAHHFGSDVASPGAPNRTPAKFRAMGGPVYAGQPYIVGEHRPELFIPEQNGRIDPNPRGGEMGASELRGRLTLSGGEAYIEGVHRKERTRTSRSVSGGGVPF